MVSLCAMDQLPESEEHHHNLDRDQFVRYRSVVSSVCLLDIDKLKLRTSLQKKWTHIGGNITITPAIGNKFSLLSKVSISNRDNGIHSMAISPKGRVVGFGLDSGEIQLRRLSVLHHPGISVNVKKPSCSDAFDINTTVTCLRFMPDMENVLVSSDLSGQINIVHTDKMCKYTMAVEKNNQINSIDVNSEATRIVSGGKDALLRVYDAVTGKILSRTPPYWKRHPDSDDARYHKLRIYCVKFDPEKSNVFYSGGMDGFVKIWDLREPLKSVRTIKGPSIRGDAIDVWGNVLLTGSWRSTKSMDLWDTTSGQLIDNLVPSNRASSLDGEFYECVRFFDCGRDGTIILCGGSGTGRFEIYNLQERRMEFAVVIHDTVNTIASTSSSIVCAGLDGVCRVIRYNRVEE